MVKRSFHNPSPLVPLRDSFADDLSKLCARLHIPIIQFHEYLPPSAKVDTSFSLMDIFMSVKDEIVIKDEIIDKFICESSNDDLFFAHVPQFKAFLMVGCYDGGKR
jgi:hypothetical protein